jgi:hypothetical protein
VFLSDYLYVNVNNHVSAIAKRLILVQYMRHYTCSCNPVSEEHQQDFPGYVVISQVSNYSREIVRWPNTLKRFNRSHGHPSLAPRAQHAIKFGPGEEFLGVRLGRG